jgi:hypothetical protein
VVEAASWSRRRLVAVLLVIAAGAVLLRVTYVVTVAQYDRHAYDAIYYQLEADSVGQGGGIVNLFATPHANADHPPLTVYVLAPVARVFDGSNFAMRIEMSVVGGLVVLVIGLLGAELAGPRAGVLAALIASVYPNLWLNDTVLMAETLATLTTLLVVMFAYRLRRRAAWWDAVFAGAALGLAMLARAELALLLPLVLAPALLIRRRDLLGRGLELLGVATAVAALVVAPWVVRNLRDFDRPVLLSTGDGLVLLGSNCPDTYYGSNLGLWSLPCAVVRVPGDASVASSAERTRALRYIHHHLGRLPVVVAARLGRTFGVYAPGGSLTFASREGHDTRAGWAGMIMYYALAPLAVVGAIVLRRRRVALAPLLGPIILVFVVVATSYGSLRFRAPAEGSIVVLAAVAVDAFAARRGRRTAARAEEALSLPTPARA